MVGLEMMITRIRDGGVSESCNEAAASWMINENTLNVLNLSDGSIYAVSGCMLSARVAAAVRHIK